mmetsp:Transcript_4963/g.18458  ORF Transcript_4963/g.18458 Transcript_4963/m.18458 type:complete len:244 (+) Transcript_4963:290-1021(+)
MNTMIPSWMTYPFPVSGSTVTRLISNPFLSFSPFSLVRTQFSPITTSLCTTQFRKTDPDPTSAAPSPCKYPVSWCPMKMHSMIVVFSPSTTHGPNTEFVTDDPPPTKTPSLTMEFVISTLPVNRAGGKHLGTLCSGFSWSIIDAAEYANGPSALTQSAKLASYHSRKLRMGCQYPSCWCATTEKPCCTAMGRMFFPKSSRSSDSGSRVTQSILPNKLSMARLEKMYTPMFTCTSQSERNSAPS